MSGLYSKPDLMQNLLFELQYNVQVRLHSNTDLIFDFVVKDPIAKRLPEISNYYDAIVSFLTGFGYDFS